MKIAWKKMIDGDTSMHYYSSKAWQRLRNIYLSLHPVCEECLKHGVIKEAVHLHHLRPFMGEKTEEARWNTFLNEANLMAVCEACHYGFHYKLRHKKLQESDSLTDEEWKQAHAKYEDEFYEIENE